MSLATFSRASSADNFGAILNRLLRVEGTLFSGESLADDLGVRVQLQVGPSLIVSAAKPHSGQQEAICKRQK